MDSTDQDLLRRYVRDGAEDAFAELVRRYVGLVYSTALRGVHGDTHLAEDIAQNVLGVLARKARDLQNHPTLAGWLYTSARLSAAMTVRTLERRRRREEKLCTMNVGGQPSEPDWKRLEETLDVAMGALDHADREAIVLRFFRESDLRTVGDALGVSSEAARKRIDRALALLRDELMRRGVSSTAVALETFLAGPALTAAPVGLAATIVQSTMVASAGTASSAISAGFMATTKLKLGLGVVAGCIVLTTSLVWMSRRAEVPPGSVEPAVLVTNAVPAAAAEGDLRQTVPLRARPSTVIAFAQDTPPSSMDASAGAVPSASASDQHVKAVPAVGAVGLTGIRTIAGQGPLTRYGARPGTKLMIAGTSTLHDWKVEGKVIAGVVDLDSRIKVGEDCPDVNAGQVDAAAKITIPVSSLKSGKDLMDNIMYDALKSGSHPKITYALSELVLRESPKAGSAVEFDSAGELTVAGVKRDIVMPISMEKTPDGLAKFTGVVAVKMTDFGITPPAPKIAAGMIKTGDTIEITIEFLTKPMRP